MHMQISRTPKVSSSVDIGVNLPRSVYFRNGRSFIFPVFGILDQLALEDHVNREPRLGPWVLITEN